jgi:hypothetical protein
LIECVVGTGTNQSSGVAVARRKRNPSLEYDRKLLPSSMPQKPFFSLFRSDGNAVDMEWREESDQWAD